ncbi:MAG: DMT family transporter [Hyphomicrobiaceae bacterium]
MSSKQWLLLVFLSILWGGSFLFIGIAVHELPAFTIVLIRVGLAALLLMPLIWISGHALPRGISGWQPFAVMALFNNVLPFSLITLGQREVASGLASIINATTPLFALVIAHALSDDEKLVADKVAGVGCGLAGIAILMGPEAVLGRSSSLLGMTFCLLGCLSYGCAGFWGRRLRQTPPLVSATCQLMCSTVVLAVLAGVVDRPWTLAMPSRTTILALVALAALSTAVAYIVFFRILSVSGPTNAMLVTLLIPISGVALGALVLHERVAARHIVGAVVIALGLVAIDGRPLAALRRRIAT